MKYKDAILTYVAKNDISYAEFGRRANISKCYITQILKSTRNPSNKILKKIELLTNEKIDELKF